MKAGMARGLAMSLLVLSLLAVSMRTDDEQSIEPYSLDDIFESGEGEDVKDLSNAVERLLQRKEAASQQMRNYRPESDFEVNDESDKESRSNGFDDSESQRLQSNIIIAREVGQIRSRPHNDFRSQKSKIRNDDDEEQMKRNHFNRFISKRGDLDFRGSEHRPIKQDETCDCKGEPGQPSPKCCKGQKKRINVDGIRIQRAITNSNCKGVKDVLSNDCPIQSKRNNFDGFRIQREESNPECKGKPGIPDEKDCQGQRKRNHFDGFRIQREESNPECKGEKGKLDEVNCTAQMKGNQFDGFRRSLSTLNAADKRAVQIRKRKHFANSLRNRQNYGDLGTLPTEERQADRRLFPIQRSNFDYLEVEHNIQSRESESDQAEFQANDYNSDGQLTNREDIDGQESRQIHDDQFQHLQPESDEGSPTSARRSNPLSDLDDDYGIDQEKRLEVHSIADNYKKSSSAEDLRPSESDFEVYDENSKESSSNRFDDSESQRLQSNVIAREVGQIRSRPYNDVRSQKSKIRNDDEEEQMKRNHFNGFIIKRGDLDFRGSGHRPIKRGESCDCTGAPGKDSPPCCKGKKKRIIVDGNRIKRKYPRCKGEKGKLNNKACPIQTNRINVNGIRVQRGSPNCTGGKLNNKACIPQMNRINVNGIRVQREDSECKGVEGELSDTCKGQIKRNQFDGSERSLSNLNTADKRTDQIKNHSKILRNRQKYGDLGTLETEERQADRPKRLFPIQRDDFDDLEVEHNIQSRESDIDQAELEANDYNSDGQLTNREDIDGQESRQIYDDHLQPQPDEGSPTPARRSNPLSDLDDDYGIDQEKRLEVHSYADNYKESSTAEETSPEDLLALLVRLVRDKRQKDPLETT